MHGRVSMNVFSSLISFIMNVIYSGMEGDHLDIFSPVLHSVGFFSSIILELIISPLVVNEK